MAVTSDRAALEKCRAAIKAELNEVQSELQLYEDRDREEHRATLQKKLDEFEQALKKRLAFDPPLKLWVVSCTTRRDYTYMAGCYLSEKEARDRADMANRHTGNNSHSVEEVKIKAPGEGLDGYVSD
jgi:hypothetical protein